MEVYTIKFFTPSTRHGTLVHFHFHSHSNPKFSYFLFLFILSIIGYPSSRKKESLSSVSRYEYKTLHTCIRLSLVGVGVGVYIFFSIFHPFSNYSNISKIYLLCGKCEGKRIKYYQNLDRPWTNRSIHDSILLHNIIYIYVIYIRESNEWKKDQVRHETHTVCQQFILL